MSINRSASTVLQCLLMLGMLVLWGSDKYDARSRDSIFASCEKSLEEVLEEDVLESIETDGLEHVFDAVLQTEDPIWLPCTIEQSRSISSARYSSGWLMPLRI